MARPTPTPTPPVECSVTAANGRMNDPWVLFVNRVVQFIATLTQRGVRADQPPATSVFPGTLYFVTDELVTERSNGTIWESYSA